MNWESRNGKNYSVPAKLLLWGNVVYSDGTETLLASIRSLRSTTVMPAHHRMFFATGDYICDEKTGLSVVEHILDDHVVQNDACNNYTLHSTH